jgi:ABC-type nitrate/sulfonate/bicarbonate transport system substrate-binding protein
MTARPGLWAPIILSLLVIGTGMPVNVTAQETIRVATPLLPTPAFPQMLASDKGFFQKRGLKAEFIRINSEPTTYQALIAGDVHVTSGAPVGLVLSHAQGVDVVALASWYNIVPYTLATRVIAQLMKRLKIDLPIRALFESPTVAETAKVIVQIEKLSDEEPAR